MDAVGIGAGVVDRLRELGYSVIAFNGGESPTGNKGKERFANRIAEVWWAMRTWLLAGEATIPNDQRLIGQLTGRKYEIMSDRKVKLESKEKLAKSPDKADALAMSFAPDTTPRSRVRVIEYTTGLREPFNASDYDEVPQPVTVADQQAANMAKWI